MTATETTATRQAPGTRPRRRLWRVLAALGVPLVILVGYATWINTQPYTLQASVQIHASPLRVWAVLTDQAAYPRWNPFIISSAGQLKPGATLVNKMHDATGNTTFTPVVQVVHPGHELQWIGRVGLARFSTVNTPSPSARSARAWCSSPSGRTSPAWRSRSTKVICTPTPSPCSAP